MERFHQRVIHRCADIAVAVLLFFIGLVNLVAISGRPVWLHEFLQENLVAGLTGDDSLTSMISQRVFWLLATLLPLFLLLQFLHAVFGRRRTLVLKTESGYPLRIRETAVKRYVSDRLRELDSVENAKVAVRSSGKTLRVQVEVSAAIEKSAADIEREIRESIERYVRQGLGIDKVVVEPEFVGLRPASPGRTPAPAAIENDLKLAPTGLSAARPTFGETETDTSRDDSDADEEDER